MAGRAWPTLAAAVGAAAAAALIGVSRGQGWDRRSWVLVPVPAAVVDRKSCEQGPSATIVVVVLVVVLLLVVVVVLMTMNAVVMEEDRKSSLAAVSSVVFAVHPTGSEPLGARPCEPLRCWQLPVAAWGPLTGQRASRMARLPAGATAASGMPLGAAAVVGAAVVGRELVAELARASLASSARQLVMMAATAWPPSGRGAWSGLEWA